MNTHFFKRLRNTFIILRMCYEPSNMNQAWWYGAMAAIPKSRVSISLRNGPGLFFYFPAYFNRPNNNPSRIGHLRLIDMITFIGCEWGPSWVTSVELPPRFGNMFGHFSVSLHHDLTLQTVNHDRQNPSNLNQICMVYPLVFHHFGP